MSEILSEIYATIDASYDWYLTDGEYLDELDALDAIIAEYEAEAEAA